jgi:hypothetical protein
MREFHPVCARRENDENKGCWDEAHDPEALTSTAHNPRAENAMCDLLCTIHNDLGSVLLRRPVANKPEGHATAIHACDPALLLVAVMKL